MTDLPAASLIEKLISSSELIVIDARPGALVLKVIPAPHGLQCGKIVLDLLKVDAFATNFLAPVVRIVAMVLAPWELRLLFSGRLRRVV